MKSHFIYFIAEKIQWFETQDLYWKRFIAVNKSTVKAILLDWKNLELGENGSTRFESQNTDLLFPSVTRQCLGKCCTEKSYTT